MTPLEGGRRERVRERERRKKKERKRKKTERKKLIQKPQHVATIVEMRNKLCNDRHVHHSTDTSWK